MTQESRSTPKTVVYTCTFLDYDEIYTPIEMTPGVDYVLYADRAPRFVRGWRWRPLPPEVEGLSRSMANRYCKFFPHKLFPDADVSIYVDGKTLIAGNLAPLIAEFVESGAEIGLFRHPKRSDVVEELALCKEIGKISPEDHHRGDAQIEAYFADGLPREHLLTENGILLRRHDGPGLAPAMEMWWDEMNRHTPRDQLSLPYVLYKTQLPIKLWTWDYRRNNPYFMRYPHKKLKKAQGLAHQIEMYTFVQRRRKGAAGLMFRGLNYAVRTFRSLARV